MMMIDDEGETLPRVTLGPHFGFPATIASHHPTNKRRRIVCARANNKEGIQVHCNHLSSLPTQGDSSKTSQLLQSPEFPSKQAALPNAKTLLITVKIPRPSPLFLDSNPHILTDLCIFPSSSQKISKA